MPGRVFVPEAAGGQWPVLMPKNRKRARLDRWLQFKRKEPEIFVSALSDDKADML